MSIRERRMSIIDTTKWNAGLILVQMRLGCSYRSQPSNGLQLVVQNNAYDSSTAVLTMKDISLTSRCQAS
jgi:hypothetical protein